MGVKIKRDSGRDWESYASDYNLGHNLFGSCFEVGIELYRHGWQTWTIFRSEFLARFKGTVMGVGWGVLLPIVPLLAFLVLTLMRVFPTEQGLSPETYMMVGVSVWLYLQGLVVAPSSAVEKHAAVLKSSRFPLICMFAASYGKHMFEMLVRLVFIVPILTYSGNVKLGGLVFAVLELIPATAFGVAIGILVGMLGIVIKDVRNVVEIFFRYLIFVSFAIFPLSKNGVGWWLYTLNPFAIYVDNIRSALTRGGIESPEHLISAIVVSCLVLVVSLHLYHVLERRVAGAI